MGRIETLLGADAEVVYDRNFQLLLLSSVISPLGAAVVSPVLDSLTGPFGASEAEIGLLMSAFTAPAILLIPVVGVVSDRLGRKPVLASGLLLFGLAGVAIRFTTDFTTVLALRLAQGVGYTGIGPVLITAVGDLYRGPAEATAQGIRFTTVSVSLTVFPLLSGLLVALGWFYPFYLYALAVPTALVVLVLFEEPTDLDDADRGGDVSALLALARRPGVAATLVGRSMPTFLWFAFLTYNSIVVVRLLDGTPGEAGALVAVASVTSAVGSTQVGRLTAAFDSRAVPLSASLVVSAGGIAGFALAPSVLVAGVAAVGVGAGFGIGISLFRSSITAQAPEELRGGLVSVGESVGRLGSTVAPIVMGAVIGTLATTAGFGPAVRTTVLGTAVGCVAVGVGCVVLAERSGVLGSEPVVDPAGADD